MKPYSRYRTTDIEWIGDIPDHWELRRYRYWVDLITLKAIEDGNKVGLENIESKTGRFISTESAFESGGVAFEPNDVLFGKLRPYLAKVWLADKSGQAVGDFYVFRAAKGVIPKFLFYRTISAHFIETVDSSTYGAKMPRANWDFISGLAFPLPSLLEQETIAAFLDHQTGLIDQLIEKNTKLLELLDVQRKAIINEAVTKGLDPKAPMKNSGVEWLGEVPRHWRPVKIKYLFEFQSGATPSTKNPAYWNGTIPWVSSKDMKTKYIERTEDYITEEGLANSSCSLIVPGSVIVVSRSGILQRTIPVAINRVPLVVNQDQKVLTPKGACSAEFFYHYVKGNEPILLNEWIKAGATVESIEIGAFMDHAVHIPPVAEQKEIVNHLIDRTKTMDEVRQRIEQQNVLLGDYRQSLISEAVTGKIDLREWAPAPQQTVEP